MKLIRYLSLMAVLLCSIAVNGHPKPADDEEVKYRLTVIADPSVGCSASGSGNYAAGAEVFLRSTAGTGFVFQSWTREDGTIVSTSANFTYTKLEGDETLTAHFKYDPSSPDDPVTPVFPDKEKKDKYILKLLTEEGGTNLSGSGEYEPATVVTISVGIQANFTFVGWYDEKGAEVGTTSTLNYTMGEEDVTLTARFNYTPDSPNDPDKPDIPDKPTPLPTHTVTLMATEGGSVSGGGTFEEGSVVTINASTAANFTFAGWFCADTLYTADATFTYTIDEEDIVFEARFDYTPGSPGDPDIPVFPDKPKPSHNVCVTASPTEGGSVSVSVNPVEEEHSTRLSASPATGFVFTGWYSADTLYSDNATVDYLMGTEDVAFEARFDYNPGSPDDPAMPATDKFSLYLSTVRAMPGRTVQYPIYLNTQDTVCDMRFHLTFPKGTTPDMTNIRLSGKAVGYTLTYEKIETNGVKAFREPRRAPEESPDSTVYAISLTGGKTAPCNTRLLTIAVTVDENFQGTGNQKVGINQISMTNTDGNTETAAARHGSLMMRESSELGLYYYLTLISTGSGTTRVGSKSVRNALQVVEMLEGTSTNIYFTPDNGYHLDRVTKDDVDISDQVTDNRLLISDVKDDIQLEVSYAEGASASWPLTVTATGHGTVTFDDTVVQNGEQIFNVSHGAEAVLTVKPEKGYHVAAVTIDGKDALSKLTANGKLTIESMSVSVTVAVTFAANVYDVTFRYGETVYKQTEVAYGDPITAPEDPMLKGHTFASWMPEVPETMPDSALVFTAQFTVNQYTVTFTVPSVDWQEVLTLDYGAAIEAPTPPEWTDYTFVGWDNEIPALMPDYDLTFTGLYTQNPVTITAMSYTVEYGNPLPEFSYSSEGATITGKPQIICEAVQGSPVGTYPIVITKGSVTNDNDTYINGTLIIVKAPLTITLAEDYTRYEGDDNPEFKFAYSGWKMNDDESVLTEKPTATCEAGVLSPAGDYPVFISGGAAENYEVTCMNGILKVLSFESSDSITVSIVVDGIGFVRLRGQEVYDEGSVRVPRGANAVLELQAEAEGNVLSKLSVNGKGVTGKVRQGVYVIPHVEGDVSVHALFSGDIVSFTVDGINYTVTSFAQHTVKVVTGDYEGNIVVPDEVEYEAEIWTVRGLSKYAFFDCPQLSAISVPASVQIIENNFVRGCPHLAAIEWQTSKELTWPMLTNYRNPNMLFYAKDRALIPSDAQNIVINGYADRIVLTDMTNRGDFYCPTAFTAGEIMYQHTYAQSTKIGKCQGWESIVLPFNVQDIRHAEKGVIHPFAALSQEMIDSDAAPFWLYKFSDEGFVHSAEIEANVPYIISMPNDSRYEEEYILGGQVTFSATNVEVRPSSEAVAVVGADRSFFPTYQSIEQGEPNCYLLNVSDEFAGHAEGSVFARYRREGRPFEAYFSMADGGGVKEFIGVFEEMQDGIESLFPDPSPVREGSAGAVYDLSGRKLINHHSSNHKLHYGIYIKDGKKIVVK